MTKTRTPKKQNYNTKTPKPHKWVRIEKIEVETIPHYKNKKKRGV
jgi:hypothetical protein